MTAQPWHTIVPPFPLDPGTPAVKLSGRRIIEWRGVVVAPHGAGYRLRMGLLGAGMSESGGSELFLRDIDGLRVDLDARMGFGHALRYLADKYRGRTVGSLPGRGVDDLCADLFAAWCGWRKLTDADRVVLALALAELSR